MVVTDLERVAALGADGLLRGTVDPNEAVTGHQVLPFVSLSSTAWERTGGTRRAVKGAQRRQEPLTVGEPV